MQLVPMLEIEMVGSSLPFSLTTPSATVIVGENTALSTTVTLDPDSNTANTHFTFSLPAGSSGLGVYNGTCANPGSQVGATLTAASHTITGKRVVALADGNHFLLIAGSGSTACNEIPNVINGPYTDKMVNLSVLKPYNISMSERNTTLNTSVLMYVPLNVVYDDTGGSKTAFRRTCSTGRAPPIPGRHRSRRGSCGRCRPWATNATRPTSRRPSRSTSSRIRRARMPARTSTTPPTGRTA
jgi:hypothetical protein